MRRVRLDGGDSQGNARGPRAGAGRGPEGAAGRADRAGIDLRPGGACDGSAGDGGAGSGAAAFVTPSHAPIPTIEFERAELLAAEKEAIGLFISAHPLKEVGAALRVSVDCGLGELATRRDGDWVTVGGMITQAKRIRTKKGDPMMFATLDDLECLGRAARIRKGPRRARDMRCHRLDRPRPRPRGPPRPGQDVYRRPGDRAVRADLRRGPCRPRAGVAGGPAGGGAAPAPRRDLAARDRPRRAEGAARRVPRASPTS